MRTVITHNAVSVDGGPPLAARLPAYGTVNW